MIHSGGQIETFMSAAVKEAAEGVAQNHGGPFGCIIVKSGKIISRAHNMVVFASDPTAHAEMLAIQRAARKLKTYILEGCSLYTTCEPCPMCLCAILWARIDDVVFGCDQHDARALGFDDHRFYQVLAGQGKDTILSISQHCRDQCLDVFNIWKQDQGRTLY